ncbi:MAG TPA: methyltransferase domain-containing protein [Actinokineospora sp.]|jgi:ubiquinone/menaquinone biosynthesis C-methylase UbiE|nr:methyltransferase domain-containing protein [Actinokineospora sp.]
MPAAQESPESDGTAELYDLSNIILCEVWDENFHHGYWLSDDDESSNRVATDRLTDLLIAKSGLDAGGRVLDVGCGIGLSAFRLADATPAHVVGISNNQAQIDEANRRAAAKGLADRVGFEFADVLALPYPDDSFDVAWVFESLMHMDRVRTLKELGRVLRPGGRVVITDQLQTARASDADQAVIDDLMRTMQASTLLFADGYQAMLATTGLELVEFLDISRNTKKTPRRVIDGTNAKFDELVERFGESVIPMLEMFRDPTGLMPEIGYLLAVVRKSD